MLFLIVFLILMLKDKLEGGAQAGLAVFALFEIIVELAIIGTVLTS